MKISVALCTYNGERYLSEQLNSILNQSNPVNQIIICDDASSDNTINIIKEYSKKFPEIISLNINKLNIGTIRNFENAILLTTGDIIFLSDQDDIWYGDKVEKMISAFNDQSDTLLLFTNGDLIDENALSIGITLWDKWSFPVEIRKNWKKNKLAFNDLLRNYNKVTGATIAFRKELKKHILPIQVPCGYWHDAWFALHAAALNGLSFTEDSLIQYRIHAGQQIGIPESIKPSSLNSNFNESVSYDEFYLFIGKKYPKLFREHYSYKLLKNLNWLIKRT